MGLVFRCLLSPIVNYLLCTLLTREALANGKPTFLRMSHACYRHWYPCYGGAKRNVGHQVRKPSVRRLCLVSGSAVYFGCFPFRCRGWPEAIPENIAAVLFLLRRCVRSLLRPQRHLGSPTIRCRKCCGFCTSRPAHIHGGHRSIRAVGCSNACHHFSEVYRSHSDVGRRVFGRTPRITCAGHITIRLRRTPSAPP